MCPEDLPQGMVQEVSGGVVRCNLEPAGDINLQSKLSFAVFRDSLGYVDRKIILLDCVEDPDLLSAGRDNGSGVTDLSAHFGIERSPVEDELEHCLVFLLDRALLEKPYAIQFKAVIAQESGFFTFEEYCPVAEFIGGGIAGPFLLLQKFGIEPVHVNGESVLGSYKPGKVDRESISIIKDEGISTGNGLASGVFLLKSLSGSG